MAARLFSLLNIDEWMEIHQKLCQSEHLPNETADEDCKL